MPRRSLWTTLVVALAFLLMAPALVCQTGIVITPSTMSMVVGETRSMQAFQSDGTPATGLTWFSSDPTIATLSNDDPPIVAALATGQVTITAGDGSSTLTVYAGPTLPLGTVKWTTPNDGSGVYSIVPAVPTGVADVFAMTWADNVQAVRSDGTVAWTANVGLGSNILPDFQGGLVVVNSQSVHKRDGMTGQANPTYTSPNGNTLGSTLVHTDGTIFTVDGDTIVAIDPTTGAPKFPAVAMEDGVVSANGNCGEFGRSEGPGRPLVGQGIIAGDGYAYVPYLYQVKPLASNDKVCREDGYEAWGSHIEVHSRIWRQSHIFARPAD